MGACKVAPSVMIKPKRVSPNGFSSMLCRNPATLKAPSSSPRPALETMVDDYGIVAAHHVMVLESRIQTH
jgi:hypothetical protein